MKVYRNFLQVQFESECQHVTMLSYGHLKIMFMFTILTSWWALDDKLRGHPSVHILKGKQTFVTDLMGIHWIVGLYTSELSCELLSLAWRNSKLNNASWKNLTFSLSRKSQAVTIKPQMQCLKCVGAVRVEMCNYIFLFWTLIVWCDSVIGDYWCKRKNLLLCHCNGLRSASALLEMCPKKVTVLNFLLHHHKLF